MSKQVQFRRGTTAQHSGFTGADGEMTIDTTKKTIVVHDGSTAGGFPSITEAGGTITGNLSVTGTVDGRDLSVDGTKLDGVEDNANKNINNNLLINGWFDIWQRSTSDTHSSSSWVYGSVDRWRYFTRSTTGSAIISKGTMSTLYEETSFLRFDQTVATTAGPPALSQPIENVKTAQGKKVQVRMLASGSNTGTYSIYFSQRFGAGGSSDVSTSEQTFTITGSWVEKTFEFDIPSTSGKTIGTSNFLDLVITPPIGGTGTTDISGVEVVISDTPGTRATRRSVGEELALCQRYFQYFETYAGAVYNTGGAGAAAMSVSNYAVEMRTIPTVVPGTVYGWINVSADSLSFMSTRASRYYVTQGGTVGNFYGGRTSNTADAEL